MRKYSLKRPVINGKRSRVWFVTWSENGRSHRRSTGETNERLAEEWRARFITAMEMPEPGATVSAICDAYLADRIEDGIADPDTVRFRLMPVKAILGAYEPDALTRPQVRFYHAQRRKDVSDSTINAECRALRAALNWAHRMRWIDSVPHIEAPRAAPPRERFLSWDEFMALYDAAAPHLKTFLALALFTGQRKQAILDLTWDCIDWNRAGIFFPQTGSRKSRTPYVPCNTSLALALGTAALTADGDYVVSWQGKRVTKFRSAWDTCKKKAGIEDVTIHDMRRTAASFVIANGGSFADAAWLLDDTIETVQRHYIRFNETYGKSVTGRIVG